MKPHDLSRHPATTIPPTPADSLDDASSLESDQTPERIKKETLINQDHDGVRADKALSMLWGVSRAQIQTWMHDGALVLFAPSAPHTPKPLKPKDKLRNNMRVLLDAKVRDPLIWEAKEQDLSLVIHTEHPDFLIVNKPPNQVVYPAAGNYENTLANGLLYAYPELAHLPRAGFVHRIDKDTSGLLVIARNKTSMQKLSQAIALREVKRVYRLLALGHTPLEGTIDQAIGRHQFIRTQMGIVGKEAQSGKDARTHFRTIQRLIGASYLEAKLDTGRTHQIRVHFQFLGHALLGEKTYRPRRVHLPQSLQPSAKEAIESFPRQALHAHFLEFSLNGSDYAFEAPLPMDMQTLLQALGMRSTL